MEVSPATKAQPTQNCQQVAPEATYHPTWPCMDPNANESQCANSRRFSSTDCVSGDWLLMIKSQHFHCAICVTNSRNFQRSEHFVAVGCLESLKMYETVPCCVVCVVPRWCCHLLRHSVELEGTSGLIRTCGPISAL
jgi:hypothetical protein